MGAAPNLPACPALDAALSYAALGWPVFPVHSIAAGRCTCGDQGCGSPGKHPRTQRGCLDATRDQDVIQGWWARWPDAGVAVATGGRLAVLDVDPRHGGDETMDRLRSELCALPDTPEVLTGGGGRHLYLAVPEGVSVACSAGRLGPGVDVRGEGGYVVAPPSLHYSGREYTWEASSDPADGVLPADWPSLWLARVASARPALRSLPGGGDPGPIPEGQRNDELFRLGRSLRSKGLTAVAICAALEAENSARCVPPLDPDEVRRIAASAARPSAGRSREWEQAHPAGSASQPVPADDAPLPVEPAQDTAVSGTWADGLRRNDNSGKVLNTFGNLCLILRHSPEYGAGLRYNRMRLAVGLAGSCLEDWDVGHIREAIERAWDCSPSSDNLRMALLTVASEHSYHPVQEYLDSLTWDGVERVDSVATEILHAVSDDPDGLTLAATQIRAWMTSAVARVYEPGCKVDTALILVGEQGWYKSTFFRVLAGGEWFSDSPIDLSNKDALLQLHDTWIYEWPEVETITSQRHAGQVKAFVASQVDLFRAPFRAAVGRVPRTNVIVGTTNEPRFLEDSTGSRRFWVVTCGGRVDCDMLREWRDQLWAEAVAHYRAGEQWHLPDDAERVRERIAEGHRAADPWESIVARYLAQRPESGLLTVREVLTLALGIPAGQQRRGDENRAGGVLRALGYASRRARCSALEAKEHGSDRVWTWEKIHATE